MKCEICKTIERLGLDPKAHESWMCADSHSPWLAFRKAQVAVHHFCVEASVRLREKWQHAGHALYRRAQYVTLGL
ncbi:MAG TPA: hypothetical protein VH724_10465 [Candidatus Angelobacter sp.]|nr:hypothetical protein [Candidatus Angelobacter sp.]